ncbi:hypothetical protein QBC46DRAFT_381259 [Diplogelasinospora grovesii]|uniref:Uncharacterized protein n=1 Tax=Diplogelasinospora grovesii TaxID=303347 RepID=A0AAN6S682_9PEZI|nr:hypothetical protein QBC46DRAFT_381259 [Diplogelasinospora grovesii]
MTDLFIQSSLAVSKNQQLVEEAVRIRQICTAEHGGKQNLAECPECFEKVLEAARLRYLKPADDKSKKEWFSSRRTFLRDLDSMFADAKDYQRDPRTIDSRIREEKSRWYAETVRTSLLRLLVADSNKIGRPGREAILEKLKDPKSAKLAEVAKDISAMLGASGNATATREATSGDSEFLRRLASSLPAGDSGAATKRLDLFKEAFFDGGRDDNRQGTAQKSQQRYIEMLGQGQSMDQVVDRILEERQAATGVREQTVRLKKRLDELRRARAAHEVEKSKKAAKRQKAASASASSSTSGNASTIFVASQPPFGQLQNQQQGSSQPPDELHTVPPCAVCGNTPSARDFICCPVCAILAGHKAVQPQQKQKQWQPTVYCSQECSDKGHTSHLETHTCASGEECIQLRDHGAANEKHADNINVKTEADKDNTSSSNTSMKHASRDDENTIVISSDSICFCAECLTSLKIATLWCSLGCADKNFQRHREAVHLVERKGVGIVPNDNDRQALHFLDEERGGTKHPRYRAKNIAQHVVSFPAAVRAWEKQNGVGWSSR